MIGTPVFNHTLAGCLIGLLALPLAADELTVANGLARLSGTVRSIDETGVMELESAIAPEPLLLKSGAVEKVEFSAPESPEPPAAALVELVNGDLLPVAIESFDEKILTITSPQAGRMEIPRQHLSSLQLGVRPRKVFYSGPRNLDEWSKGEAAPENWTFDNGRLVASGQANASMDLKLPRQFILRFTLEWAARQIPNFQIYFADPLKEKGEPVDRYYLRFSGAGLDIKREASEGKRHHDIQIFNRTPAQYHDRTLQVELRVDRQRGRLQLFLNGEPEGIFEDPVRTAPSGGGITLTSTAGGETQMIVRDLQVLEFDDSRTRHNAEDRGDPKSDSLISVDDDRWSGRLVEILPHGDGTRFRFKSQFQNEPLEIGDADVSTVFFAKSGEEPAAKTENPFVLRLRGEGRLRVASCRFDGDNVTAVHPLLGNLSFNKSGVAALERNAPAEITTVPEP